MAMATLTSTYSANFSQTLPYEKHYRKKEGDGEIGVFGAEKYFNGGIDHVHSPRITKTDSKKFESVKHEGVNLEPVIKKPVIKHHQGTAPSVGSESSWNSQSALLHSGMRNPPRPKPSKVHGKSFIASLAGCKCYCSDRDSVDTEEVVQVGEISFKRPGNGGKLNKTVASTTKACLDQVNKPSAEPWIKEDLFSFPIMSSNLGIRPVKVPISQGEVDEFGRKSLEVFGSPVLGRRQRSLSLDKRLKMLSWDASQKVEETDHCKDNNYNDAESDASSDLFEIESVTGGKGPNPFLGRQAYDAASGCVTPTTCYAPSEASIEWSVVTASAADFSVMSDYEDRSRPSISLPSPIKRFAAATTTTTNAKPKHNNNEFHGRRSSGLLGCNSQKAVKVAGDAYRTNDKAGFDPRMRRVSDSYMPATRFQADQTKLVAFERTQTPRILPNRSLPHSLSPQPASHLLYIQ
ncbi:hypothetical protein PTKIN_Ptkin17bG0157600 [Pterospermum kingtungense]